MEARILAQQGVERPRDVSVLEPGASWRMGLKIKGLDCLCPGVTPLQSGAHGRMVKDRDPTTGTGPTFAPVPVVHGFSCSGLTDVDEHASRYCKPGWTAAMDNPDQSCAESASKDQGISAAALVQPLPQPPLGSDHAHSTVIDLVRQRLYSPTELSPPLNTTFTPTSKGYWNSDLGS